MITRWLSRLGCIRHGHSLLCGNEGHICIRCKRFWRHP